MESYCYRKEIKHNSNPSFSSTLLDAIYSSIDNGDDEQFFYEETLNKKKNSINERSCIIEKWMETKASEKMFVRRKSEGDFHRNALFLNSSSSSSDSSSGGGFSYSETEFCDYGVSSLPSSYKFSKPKPIKTTISPQKDNFFKKQSGSSSVSQPKPQQEDGVFKTKSRALKIYGDLKKVKQQPLSPGGRLASFLNTIFTVGNGKKGKKSSTEIYGELGSKSANTSTCSSASSFSRSCLSKTPSSRGKSSTATKRSVRFYPVSVIVDEDCQPCGHKNLYDEIKNRRVEEASRNYLLKKVGDAAIVSNKVEVFEELKNDEDIEDEDAESYASSDLFELDNLSAIDNIDIERYRQELPVYETTHIHTNRAIANGFLR